MTSRRPDSPEQGLPVAPQTAVPARCATCRYPPTRRISYDLSKGRVRRTEAFCDAHGGWLLKEPHRRPVVELIAA